MKLATLNDGSRDGQLVVVSRDLVTAHYATGIASHLQQVLQDWNFLAPQLQDLYDTLNHGKARHAFPLDVRQCMAPLPRAYLLAVGDGLARPAGRAAMPLRLAFADQLQGACAPLRFAHAAQQADFEAGVAVLTGDIPQGASPAHALDGVRLLALVNQGVDRAWQAQPALALLAQTHTAFSPVAVTPDELVWGGESAWSQGRLNLPLQCQVNGRKFGLCEVGRDMNTDFGELMAQLCQVRSLRAGSIVSAGEVRHREASPWLAQGDTVWIDMKGRDGQSVFGAIDQDVQLGPQAALSAV